MDESGGKSLHAIPVAPRPLSGGPGRLLNVNDDEATRYMVSRILRRAGYQVEEADTGIHALEQARKLPDLIVLDVRLPDISGLDVCRTLKSDPLTARIPILQTSATFISAERKAEGLESGADGYLVQPIEPPELIATVRALLRARQAEDALRRSALDWQRTFEALGDGVALVSPGGEVDRVNPAMRTLLGEPFNTAACTRRLDSLLPEGLSAVLTRAAEAEDRATFEIEHDSRTFRVVVDPVRTNTGTPERFILVASDVTGQKALEQQHLRRADELAEDARRKDEFLAMLAHELRNPLHAISTANRLQDQLKDGDPNRTELRDAVARQVRHLARLVDDLLDVSRVTRGKIELNRTCMNLVDCVQNGIDMVAGQAEHRRQSIQWVRPTQPMPVSVDGLRLEQALVNVFSNAIKYSPEGERIEVGIEARTENGEIVAYTVWVRDHGLGLAPDKLEEIFDLFVQVDQSLARSRGGLGIGLTVARSLVELHGGRIWAESPGEGLGSTFFSEFPRSRQDLPHVGGETDDWPVPPAGRSLRILIIEDNEDALFALRTLLESMGHRVWAEADGVRGLEVARHESLDLALIDIGLPGLDGYSVARRLKLAHPNGDGPRAVAISGYGQMKDQERASEAGFSGYLVKPVQPRDLLTVLASVDPAEE